jgi:phosphoglucosamine mutase
VKHAGRFRLGGVMVEGRDGALVERLAREIAGVVEEAIA